MLVKRHFLKEDTYGVIWEIKRGIGKLEKKWDNNVDL